MYIYIFIIIPIDSCFFFFQRGSAQPPTSDSVPPPEGGLVHSDLCHTASTFSGGARGLAGCRRLRRKKVSDMGESTE